MRKLSILEKEINEQPLIIRNLLKDETAEIRRITNDLRDRFQHVIIAARGTSDNAARYAKYLFGVHNHLQVSLAAPSLFTLYKHPPALKGGLVMGISQSGMSPDIVAVLKEGRKQGCPTLAITNDLASPLAQTADYIIPLHAGVEKAVAATKTYTASLSALALFSAFLEEDNIRLEQLQCMPEWVSQTLELMKPAMKQAIRYRYMIHCAVIGRGYNYATGFELALKIKELTGVVAEPYSSADFRHGPIAMIRPGFPVILISPKGIVHKDMQVLSERLQELRAEQIIISDDPRILKNGALVLPLPEKVPEWLSPITAILPGQLLAMTLAQAIGLNVDHPIGLSKVTETF